jgi:hypothetical protein
MRSCFWTSPRYRCTGASLSGVSGRDNGGFCLTLLSKMTIPLTESPTVVLEQSCRVADMERAIASWRS